MKNLSQRDLQWAAGLSALWLLRLIAILFWMDPYNADAVGGYIPIAQNLFSGRGYSMALAAPFTPTAYRMPGYPLFLAIFYCPWPHHPEIAIFVQALLDALTAVVLYRLAFLLSGSKTTARLSMLGFFLYPFTLVFIATFFRDTFFAFVIVASALLFLHALERPTWRRIIAFGALMSISSYIREDGVYFLFIFTLIWLWKTRRNLKIALAGSCFFWLALAVALAPWTLRNQHLFHRFMPLGSVSYVKVNWSRANLDIDKYRMESDIKNAWVHLVPSMETVPTIGIFPKLQQRYLLPLIDRDDAVKVHKAGDLLTQAYLTDANPGQFEAMTKTVGNIPFKYMSHYPWSYGVLVVHRMFHYILSARTGDFVVAITAAPLRALCALMHFLLMPAGFLGLWLHKKARWLLLPLIFPYAFMALSGWPQQRYAMPVLPFIFLGVALLVARIHAPNARLVDKTA